MRQAGTVAHASNHNTRRKRILPSGMNEHMKHKKSRFPYPVQLMTDSLACVDEMKLIHESQFKVGPCPKSRATVPNSAAGESMRGAGLKEPQILIGKHNPCLTNVQHCTPSVCRIVPHKMSHVKQSARPRPHDALLSLGTPERRDACGKRCLLWCLFINTKVVSYGNIDITRVINPHQRWASS